jgi:hypothetical protein
MPGRTKLEADVTIEERIQQLLGRLLMENMVLLDQLEKAKAATATVVKKDEETHGES